MSEDLTRPEKKENAPHRQIAPKRRLDASSRWCVVISEDHNKFDDTGTQSRHQSAEAEHQKARNEHPEGQQRENRLSNRMQIAPSMLSEPH